MGRIGAVCINLGTGSLSGSLSLPVHCQCRMLSYLAPTSRKSLNVQVVTTRCDTVMKPCKPVFKRRRRRRSDEERPFRRWVAELQLASVQAQLIGPEQSEQRPMGCCSFFEPQEAVESQREANAQNKRNDTNWHKPARTRARHVLRLCVLCVATGTSSNTRQRGGRAK